LNNVEPIALPVSSALVGNHVPSIFKSSQNSDIDLPPLTPTSRPDKSSHSALSDTL